jgi:sigma-E factor negative regulatory protein RseB
MVFLASTLVFAAEEPVDPTVLKWLQDMRQAAGILSYQGTMVYLQDRRMETFQIFHGVIDGVERERMLSTSSPMREIIRNAQKVTCYFPDSKTVAVDQKSTRRSILVDVPENVSALSKLYDFKLGTTMVLAQKQARLISITPKDDMRYSRHLWVDVISKLPLKLELLDGDNQSVEQIVYTELNVHPSLSANSFAATTHPDESWNTKEHQLLSAESLQWTLNSVPDGFHLVSYSRLKRGMYNSEIDYILLSDGFASVSIYIDQVKGESTATLPRKLGAVNSVSRRLDDYLITVMGEVPEKTVQAIAAGIRH